MGVPLSSEQIELMQTRKNQSVFSNKTKEFSYFLNQFMDLGYTL